MDFQNTNYGMPGRTPAYAGFFRRWLAFSIDSVIGVLLMMLLIPLLVGAMTFEGADRGAYDGIFWISLLLSALYGGIMESSPLQGTLGKLILGIKVVNTEGERLSFLSAFGRSGIKIISVLVMGIGCIVAAFTEKRQALHDFPAHSVVVRKNATQESYSPAVPYVAATPHAPVEPFTARMQQTLHFNADSGSVLTIWETQGAVVENIEPAETQDITAEFQKVLYSQLAAAGLPMSNAGSVNSIHIFGHFILLDGGKRAQRYFTNGLAGKARLEAEGAVIVNGVHLISLYAKNETGLAFQVFGGENKRMLKISAVNCAGQISRQAIQALAALRKETPA